MLSIDLPTDIERNFKNVVQDYYNGNLQAAISSFLKLHKKYGWKEQLIEDVESIRSEVRKKGGITDKAINDAIGQYRSSIGNSNE